MSLPSARALACVLLFLLATTPVIAADRPWKLVVTPQYRVLSQLRDGETDGWVRNFDQFILSTSDVLQMDVKALPPLTVVLFERDKDYTPYKPQRANGRTANVSGQFVRRQTWSMIGMAHENDNVDLRRILQHEATHWLMSADQARQPAWFREGIAEMFSTFERKGDVVNWGKPIGSHLGLLRTSGTTPLGELLVEPSAIFDQDERAEQFYAQSWLFTHFLMLSKDGARRPLLFKFLQAFRTESGEATVNAAFGPALKDIERDFKLYVDQAAYTYMKLPTKPAMAPSLPQPVPAALVEASLGSLALGAGHEDLARTHAAKAIALDGKAPDGYTLLAYIALEKRDFDEAAVHAAEALERGSKDSDLFILLGDSYVHGKNALETDAARMRVSMYENAVNLRPQRLAIYERLAEALMRIDKPREEDAKFLGVGSRLFPGEDWLRVGSAVVEYRLGHREAAMKSMEAALRVNGTLDGAQRAYATGMRGRWLLDDMRAEMDAAVGKNDFAGAHGIVARYRERVGKDADLISYLDQTDSDLEMRDLLSRFDLALRAHKKAELQAVAERLLARPDLSESLRSYLQQGMRTVK
jgi:tetratricopeptide (TPR) repeat protein